MKKILLASICAISLQAVDYSAIYNSVDKKKAAESVNTEEAIKTYNKGDKATLEDVKKSIDTDKAIESIDKNKFTNSLFK